MRSLKVLTLVFIFVLLVQDGKTWRRRRRRRRSCPLSNCAVSSWSGWNRCTHKCGSSGTQTRTRRKLISEACGGSCPYTFRETRACNRYCPNGGTPRGAGCACKVGFTGTCCESDINECARKPCQHICTNTRGSFTCSCHTCYKKDGTRCNLEKCKIGNKCYSYGTANPNNFCQHCHTENKFRWTNNNGQRCNDNKLNTKNDRCSNGACVGTRYSCLPCEQHDGTGCQVKSGYCVIQVGGKKTCVRNNQVNPSNPCQQCNVKSQHKWTINNSLSCSDNNVLTKRDRCVNGTCLCKPSVSVNSWTDKPVVHGNWTRWGDWAKCSKSCNSGTQSRQRNCTNPAPSRCGRQCSGHSTESRKCNTHHCPVDGKWSPWRAWSECSKSCGGGKQKRMRTCTSPPPGFGGRNCVGQKVEDRQCNTHRCPVDCKSSSNGGYPHYSNCSKFVICVNGKKQVKCCPAGQHYNPVTKLCDLPKNVACTTREEQYAPIGCFADTWPRAFSRFVANLRNSIDWYNLNKTIDSCAKKVRKHCGWTYFGIQFYGECWSGPDESYNRYNKSKNCVAGVGKAYANYVYQLIE